MTFHAKSVTLADMDNQKFCSLLSWFVFNNGKLIKWVTNELVNNQNNSLLIKHVNQTKRSQLTLDAIQLRHQPKSFVIA